MNGPSAAVTLLFFPCLHPALAGGVPAGVRFLDPGLADAGDPACLRPSGLPLADEAVAQFARECRRLRQEVKNPKDLALLAGTSAGHFFEETSFAVREELEDQLHPERVAARRAAAAQRTLCLAYMIEESLLDLAGAGELTATFRKGLAESLGIGADDGEEGEAFAAVLAASDDLPSAGALGDEFLPSWSRILSPFWALAPEDAGLFVADPGIIATWIDAGVPLGEPGAGESAAWFPDDLPLGGVLAGRETGWRLLGKSRSQPEAPWLDLVRLVVVVKPD